MSLQVLETEGTVEAETPLVSDPGTVELDRLTGIAMLPVAKMKYRCVNR